MSVAGEDRKGIPSNREIPMLDKEFMCYVYAG
jgi:hypothetical protein